MLVCEGKCSTHPTGTALMSVAIPCAASIAPTEVFFVCASRSITYINAASTVPVHTESDSAV